MFNLDLSHQVAKERYKDIAAELTNERLVAALRAGQLPWSRRVARPLGRQLLRLSLALLRYGRVEGHSATVLYQPSVGAAELN